MTYRITNKLTKQLSDTNGIEYGKQTLIIESFSKKLNKRILPLLHSAQCPRNILDPKKRSLTIEVSRIRQMWTRVTQIGEIIDHFCCFTIVDNLSLCHNHHSVKQFKDV